MIYEQMSLQLKTRLMLHFRAQDKEKALNSTLLQKKSFSRKVAKYPKIQKF